MSPPPGGAPPREGAEPDAAADADAYATRRADALARLADGDADAAFADFRWALWERDAAAPLAPDRLADALGVLSRIVVAMGQRELAELCARASTDVQDPDLLYELGYELIEVGLPAIAITVLRRCLEVVPGSEQVIAELVVALERRLRYRDAAALLAGYPDLTASSFTCRYHQAFAALMSGDLATARAVAARLGPADDDQGFMAARVGAMLARADRVAAVTSLDGRDLRGWHLVITGGVLLHRSPHGFDDGMTGRYAWLQDSAALVHTGLRRLREVLAAWRVAPPCIYAPPGRDHEIVAAAAAAVLDLPVAPWPAVGVPAPGLVVAYDLADVPWRDLERLIDRRPGQVLFAHASRWVEDGAIAPDVTTLLHQSVVPPWGAQLVVGPDGEPRRAEADPRPVEAIAADVIAAAPLAGDDLAADDLAGLAALVAAAGAPDVGRRERLWGGSPVPSNRFE